MKKIEFHPVSEIFPLMSDEEIETLADDIRENGLKQPLLLHPDGRLIDGRNRYLACQKAEVVPTAKTWDGNGDLTAFVVSLNLHRRHLNESQRAMIAAKLANRKREDTLIPGGPQNKKLDHQIQPSSRSVGEASQLLNVGKSLIHEAKTVLREGTPEEKQAVEKGEAAVSTVAKLIRKGVPAEERKAAIVRGFTDARGRRLPERPFDESVERCVEQLFNTVDFLRGLLERKNCESYEKFPEWVGRMEKARSILSRTINLCREKERAA